MNARRVAPWVVAALTVAGCLLVGLRLYARHETRLTDGDSLWRITYNVEFEADRPVTKIRLAVPADTRFARVVRQDIVYSELTAERMHSTASANREVCLVAMEPGNYQVTARFDVHLSRREQWSPPEPSSKPTAEERARWLRSTTTIPSQSPAILNTVRSLRAGRSGEADPVTPLFDFCTNSILRGSEDEAPDDAAGVLEAGIGTELGRARTLVALCRADKLPARLVAGFEIVDRAEFLPRVWVEVLAGGKWLPYDPENGFAGELPHHFVPVRRDASSVVAVSGQADLDTLFSIVRLPAGPDIGSVGHGPAAILDLTRLPLPMHEVLAVILLMPLGALVTAVFRTVVDIRTFGTFTPSLIALSFVFADWRTGVLVFALVVCMGLVTRGFLERLKLLMVPRLGFMLTLVVVCLVFTISALDYFRLTPSAQAVLLPMVILTMTIERFYLTSEEDGPGFALQLLLGTVLVAFCCYLTLRWRAVGRLVFTFPEIHCFTLAAMVLLGRYTGYRLSELWRFRDLTRPHGEDPKP